MATVIETTADQVAAELARQGINPQERVIITIDPEENLLFKGRKDSRARVVTAGLTDADINRLIEEARSEVHASHG